MIFFRWFGFDTVGCVVAIQLFLSTYRDTFDIMAIIGLSAAVAFVYMLDRYRDLRLGVDTNNRQLIYNDRLGWMIFSMVPLIGIAGFYWINLDGMGQFILFGCAILVLVHLWLLGMGWYLYCKDVVVAMLFATVMMVGLYDLYNLWLLIALFTLFNLTVHRLIETRVRHSDYWFMGILFSVLIIVLMNSFGFHWVLFIWLGSIFAQFMLIRSVGRYWYELGELYFAIPFLMAYFISI